MNWQMMEYYNQFLRGLPPVQAYKQRMFDLLEVQEGQRVLDVGCGDGVDTLRLANLVGGRGGIAIGVDTSDESITKARRASEGSGLPVVFKGEDAHRLTIFADDFFDRCFCDRVLQHLGNPLRALGAMFRVLKPGGIVVCHEPDWGLLSMEGASRRLTVRVINYLTRSMIRNGRIGTQLSTLLFHAGFQEIQIDEQKGEFADVEEALEIIRADTAFEKMRAAKVISQSEQDSWLEQLRESAQRQDFRMVMSSFIAKARKPTA